MGFWEETKIWWYKRVFYTWNMDNNKRRELKCDSVKYMTKKIFLKTP
jgi:hypothetical protein